MEAAAGLGAMGFWIFLAAIVVAGIWFDARKRESQQETLRRVVESGQEIDPAMIDKMLAVGGDQARVDRDLKISGMIESAGIRGSSAANGASSDSVNW